MLFPRKPSSGKVPSFVIYCLSKKSRALFATIIYFVSGSRSQESDEVDGVRAVDLRLDSGSKVDDPSVNEGGDASSSNAGSSGWSSSAGIDSMNTNSADGLDIEKSTIPAITTSKLPIAKKSEIRTLRQYLV